MAKSVKFDARFVNEMTKLVSSMTADQLIDMSAWAVRKEFSGKYSLETIRKVEDICWIAAMGKRAAERASA